MDQRLPLYFLVAGEASGDVLGARLMRALKERTQGHVRFAGVGGARMEAEGMASLFPQSDLAHMGLIEVLTHLPLLMRRLRETVEAILARRPDAVITIDSPDFSFRVAKRVKKKAPRIPLIHYVAPSVWAWRPDRAKKIARFLDHLLALLPFEPPYFTKEGLGCSFVGHPLVESGAAHGQAARFYATYAVAADAELVTLLPGSRHRELDVMLPVFQAAVERLRGTHPKLALVMPTIPAMRSRIESETSTWPIPPVIVETDEDKYDAFAASRAALACSGTISIELALASVPSVIAYKVNPLTAWIVRKLIQVKYVTLFNIMQDRAVMPEFLQEDCTPEKLASCLEALMGETLERQAQLETLRTIAPWLGEGQFIPSQRAAEVVQRVVDEFQQD